MPVIGGVKKGSFSSGCQDQPLENEPWEWVVKMWGEGTVQEVSFV